MSATQPAEPPAVPAWKLVSTLAGAGAIAGLMLVFVFQLTQPVIAAHKAEVLDNAVKEVLAAPDHYETLYVHDGALHAELPAGADGERVYLGFDAAGNRVGFAIPAAQPGFQDVIRLIFGYDPESGRILGMKVLENKETPGLGDKIEKDAAFTGQFAGSVCPIVGVKGGGASGTGEVDMITGATISSRAVIRILNDAVERLGPALEAYAAEGAR